MKKAEEESLKQEETKNKQWYDEEEKEDTGFHKIEIDDEEPSLEKLEDYVQNVSPQDKVQVNIPENNTFHATTSRST